MEIYDKINNLKDSLDKEKVIIDIKNIQYDIKSNNQLMCEIKNKNIKDNELIRQYKHLENEVNYIILSINKELKSILGSDKDENHSRQI